MEITVQVYHHFLDKETEHQINKRLDRIFVLMENIRQTQIKILTLIKREEKEMIHMAAELDDMIAAVTELETVGESTIAAMEALAGKVDALVASGGTPAQFTALAAEMREKSSKIAAAIQANQRA